MRLPETVVLGGGGDCQFTKKSMGGKEILQNYRYIIIYAALGSHIKKINGKHFFDISFDIFGIKLFDIFRRKFVNIFRIKSFHIIRITLLYIFPSLLDID